MINDKELARIMAKWLNCYAEGNAIQFRTNDKDEWCELDSVKSIITSIKLGYQLRSINSEVGLVTNSISSNTYVCWKCKKELNWNNMSSIVYLSNPPKYTCKDCESNKLKNKSETITSKITYSSEKKYRKFKNCSELINHCGTKVIWITDKELKITHLITKYDNEDAKLYIGDRWTDKWITMQDLLDNYEFADGSVCGVLVE